MSDANILASQKLPSHKRAPRTFGFLLYRGSPGASEGLPLAGETRKGHRSADHRGIAKKGSTILFHANGMFPPATDRMVILLRSAATGTRTDWTGTDRPYHCH